MHVLVFSVCTAFVLDVGPLLSLRGSKLSHKHKSEGISSMSWSGSAVLGGRGGLGFRVQGLGFRV